MRQTHIKEETQTRQHIRVVVSGKAVVLAMAVALMPECEVDDLKSERLNDTRLPTDDEIQTHKE